MNQPEISIIITFYNNEGSIKELFKRVNSITNSDVLKNQSIQLVLVDDGSKDNSYKELQKILFKYTDFNIKLIKLTRNFGSYNSFLAGMCHSDGKCCVYLHSDLQDPPELIGDMYVHYQKGFKLVIANRKERDDNNLFSVLYHWFVKKYAVKNVPSGGFDLILFDQSIKKHIVNISEKNTNNIYLISWLGYPYVNIPYKRIKRKYGKSQWNFWSKVKLFLDTIFSFTDMPLKLVRLNFIISTLLLVFGIANIYFIYIEYAPVLFFLSVIFFILSFNLLILSEYLFRVHESVRNRPNFVVDKISMNE